MSFKKQVFANLKLNMAAPHMHKPLEPHISSPEEAPLAGTVDDSFVLSDSSSLYKSKELHGAESSITAGWSRTEKVLLGIAIVSFLAGGDRLCFANTAHLISCFKGPVLVAALLSYTFLCLHLVRRSWMVQEVAPELKCEIHSSSRLDRTILLFFVAFALFISALKSQGCLENSLSAVDCAKGPTLIVAVAAYMFGCILLVRRSWYRVPESEDCIKQ